MTYGGGRRLVATVLTACGIETMQDRGVDPNVHFDVATVLTACGIETVHERIQTATTPSSRLQQYLPLAVLKPREYLILAS